MAGEWLSISDCPPNRTIYKYDTESEALQAKAFIDDLACGGQCCNRHKVMHITEYKKNPRKKIPKPQGYDEWVQLYKSKKRQFEQEFVKSNKSRWLSLADYEEFHQTFYAQYGKRPYHQTLQNTPSK